MIFNPYNLAQFTGETLTQATPLPWANPLMLNNAVIVGLILIFLFIDVLACRSKGVFYHQLLWIIDTRNSRTFESQIIIYPWIKPLLIIQTFLFTGLCIFSAIDNDPARDLLSMDFTTLGNLALCVAILVVWVLFQSGLFNWFSYLFNLKDSRTIMNRTYLASFMVLSPLPMLIYIAQIGGSISSDTALVLLAVLFILSQIAFIFNGIKIFYEGIGSLLLIIVYLCTLEIAPLMVIWAKITTF